MARKLYLIFYFRAAFLACKAAFAFVCVQGTEVRLHCLQDGFLCMDFQGRLSETGWSLYICRSARLLWDKSKMVIGAVVFLSVIDPMVKLSSTLPKAQLTSFVPPPGGPQINDPCIPEGPKYSFTIPRCMARKADQDGCVQVAQRQLPSWASPTVAASVIWVTPCCGKVLS